MSDGLNSISLKHSAIQKTRRKLREDMSRVVLVDNSEKSFWLQPENGLLVCDWDGSNASDQESWQSWHRAILSLSEDFIN